MTRLSPQTLLIVGTLLLSMVLSGCYPYHHYHPQPYYDRYDDSYGRQHEHHHGRRHHDHYDDNYHEGWRSHGYKHYD